MPYYNISLTPLRLRHFDIWRLVTAHSSNERMRISTFLARGARIDFAVTPKGVIFTGWQCHIRVGPLRISWHRQPTGTIHIPAILNTDKELS